MPRSSERAPRSEHDAHRPLLPSHDLDRIFSWQETRRVSKRLTLNYKRVLYVLDPTEAARAAARQRVGLEEREDGSLTFWHDEHELLATAFPREHGVQQGHVVESKRLSETLAMIKNKFGMTMVSPCPKDSLGGSSPPKRHVKRSRIFLLPLVEKIRDDSGCKTIFLTNKL